MSRDDSHLFLDRLTKRFGDQVALDDVTLALDEGEFACLVGPSGCGKTTALRLIAGLEEPTSGHVFSAGRDITAFAPAERGMGMVFQSYALFPNMSVADNVAFAVPRRLGTKARRSRVTSLLELVDLDAFARRRPQQLSGGQQQRVAIARALAVEPKLLLLDEPLSALDPQIRVRLRAELKALQRRVGITTIMVTHDQMEALAIADRIAVMRAGKLLQVGTLQEIYAAPTDPFVGEFVGALNMLAAKVAGTLAVRLTSGALLTLPHAFASGADVLVAIRPEYVRASPRAENDAARGIAATIVDREFQGAFVRLSLRADNEPSTVLADVASASPLAESGTRAWLEFPAEHVRLFAREATT